jgi:hypothetical protein
LKNPAAVQLSILRHIKPFDFAAVGFSMALIAFSSFAVYTAKLDSRQVIVRGTEGTWVFPLNSAETISVKGPLGDTVIEIREGRASFLSSPCANQICVAAGHVHRQGQWTACLPNKVFLYIEGTNDENPQRGVSPEVPDSATW